ncbi:hypothetical protein QMZ05_11205 [Bradyrhizobium sp. INPA03-11B]|uniref:hypothetical protein n=1 Tax=Bradyrhizobium sp. INPA03-11B TaxID=418598 RepID=UPI00338DA2B7
MTDFGSSFVMSIAGEPVATDSTIDVINLATEEVLARAPAAATKQLGAAVAASYASQRRSSEQGNWGRRESR